MDVDSQPMMEETILVGDDLMTGPPSLVVPQEIASHVLQGVDLCVKLTPCFVETSETCSHMTCLKFESCELSFDGVNHLLRSLTTFKGPLKSLSVADITLAEVQKSSIGARATDSARVMKFTKDDINLFDYNVPQRVNEFVSAALSQVKFQQCPLLNVSYCPASKVDFSDGKDLFQIKMEELMLLSQTYC